MTTKKTVPTKKATKKATKPQPKRSHKAKTPTVRAKAAEFEKRPPIEDQHFVEQEKPGFFARLFNALF